MRGGFGRPFFSMAANKTYAAVTIVTGSKHCAAVKRLEGTRILAAQAPTLPVPDCTMPGQCRCRFKKYVDRREDAEGRRFKFGQELGAWYAGGQRRKSRGRREKD
jgi:hypothetical protein